RRPEGIAVAVAPGLGAADAVLTRLLVEEEAERMVGVEADYVGDAVEQQQRVADAGPADARVVDPGGHQRAAHSSQGGVLLHALGQGLVAGLQGGLEACLERRVGGGEDFGERLAGGLAGNGTAGVPAHAVGKHGEQPAPFGLLRQDALGGPYPESVLLPRARNRGRAGGTRELEAHASWTSSVHEKSGPQNGMNSSVVRPMRIMSLACSSVGLRTGWLPRRTRFDLPPCCR